MTLEEQHTKKMTALNNITHPVARFKTREDQVMKHCSQ